VVLRTVYAVRYCVFDVHRRANGWPVWLRVGGVPRVLLAGGYVVEYLRFQRCGVLSRGRCGHFGTAFGRKTQPRFRVMKQQHVPPSTGLWNTTVSCCGVAVAVWITQLADSISTILSKQILIH
jgi:hypothetical protein